MCLCKPWLSDVVDVARCIPKPEIQIGVCVYDMACKYGKGRK